MAVPKMTCEEADGVFRAHFEYSYHRVSGIYAGLDTRWNQVYVGGTGVIDPKRVFILSDGSAHLSGSGTRVPPAGLLLQDRPDDTQAVTEPPHVEHDLVPAADSDQQRSS